MARRFNFVGAMRVSQIPEDVVVVAGSFGPLSRDEHHTFTVRGVPVCPLESNKFTDHRGVAYQWCVFPDYRIMLVNAGNIIRRKVGKYDAIKAASGSD